MRPAVSNLAWPSGEDTAAINLAAELGFAGIEVAPMRTFGPLDAIEIVKVRAYRQRLAEFGLEVPALQGILFGVGEVPLFGSDAQRARLRHALLRIADIAVALGARACVFGAPSVRDPGNLAPRAARDIAVAFFREAGTHFAERGLSLCIEANPPLYGCRFLTTTREACDFVREVASPGIRLQLDTGTLFINAEPPAIIADCRLIAHCHVSEPNLDPVGGGACDHGAITAALKGSGYDGWVSAEMRQTADWQDNVRRAARLLRDTYGLPMQGEAP